MRTTARAEADYVIVLGCQVVGEYASLPLLSRGYTAIRYLNRNPEARIVLSGGKGNGENISEAEALRRLLTANEIDKERILLEDQSRNTIENFRFSNELYDLSDKKTVIVTSDYHMFRALSVAKKLKYTNVSALPSRSQRVSLPAFLLREYVTIMYYKFTGKI
ncbi:MAG: YdcF family protein [Treponema sp.]|nr:YdcF family protein [Treponema sp.]